MRIFVYARKSVKTDKGESINNQFETCKSYIRLHFGDAANSAEILEYEDEGYSGKDTNRPHFQQMMSDMRQSAKKPECIVVYRLDRISRSVADFAQLMNEMKSRNIEFISVSENIDTGTPFGEAMLLLVSVFAQMERASIAERVRDNMMLLARTGRWLGGSAPTGFESEKTEEVYIDGKSKKLTKLKINPLEMEAVRLIFNKFIELKSLAGVQKYLMHNGYKPRDGADYSRLVIKGILENPVYCAADSDALEYFRNQKSDVCFSEASCNPKAGLLAYNKRDYKLKGSPRLSKDQWIVSVGKHPAIIQGNKWVAIQHMLETDNVDKKIPNQHNEYALLSGLLICGKCGSRMFSKPRTGSLRSDKTQFDYVCGLKMNGGTTMCECLNLPGQMTDDAVCKEMRRYTEEGSLIFEHLEKMRHNLNQQVPVNPIVDIDKRIKKANEELGNIAKAIRSKNFIPELLNVLNADAKNLQDEINQLNAERRRYQNSKNKADTMELQIDIIVHSLAALKNRFDELSLNEKRNILRLLVSKIEWDGEKLHIFPNGE